MKWIWITVAGIVALVAIVAGIGATLPVKHVATRRARYKQPPEAVWAAINSQQDWRPADDITFQLVSSDPPRRLEMGVPPGLPFGGKWVYEVEPADGGSVLRITENGEVYNPIFRFVSRFIMGHTATIDQTLRALGKKFGDSVRIEE